MVGYGMNTKGYRILMPDDHVVTSRDVRFDESGGAAGQAVLDRSAPFPPVMVPSPRMPFDLSTCLFDWPPDRPNRPMVPDGAGPALGASAGVPPAEDPVVDAPGPGRYPRRERRPAGTFWMGAQGSAMAARVEHVEPVTYEEAMASDNAGQWQHEMNGRATHRPFLLSGFIRSRLMLTGMWNGSKRDS